MSNDRQLNYVNNLQNRDQNLYYVDDADELNSINLEENDKIYAINDNKLFQMEIVDQEEELSGSIVSFNGRNNTKIKSVVSNIEPIQDLHGYDNPWPGGGGKNKWNYDVNIDDNEYTHHIDISLIQPVLQFLNANIGNTVSWSASITGTPSGVNIGQVRFLSGSTNILDINVGVSKTVPDFDFMTINGCVIYGSVNGATIKNCQLELGSSVTTYTPYENICLISGHTGAEIEQTGVNVWDEEWELGILNGEGIEVASNIAIRQKNYLDVVGGQRFYIYSGSNKYVYGFWYDKNKQKIAAVNARNQIITAPAKACYYRFSMGSEYGNTYNHDISVNYPSTDTIYHPYTGNQISVTFPTEVGTIYGGKLTLNPDKTGTLVVDRANVDLGTLTWSKDNEIITFYAPFSGNAEVSDAFGYKYISSEWVYGANINAIWRGKAEGLTVEPVGVSSTKRIYARRKIYGDLTSQEFAQAMSGVQVVYELASPQTYQLTAEQVSGILTTFYGTNNIWSDIDDITVKIAEKGITAFELAPHI